MRPRTPRRRDPRGGRRTGSAHRDRGRGAASPHTHWRSRAACVPLPAAATPIRSTRQRCACATTSGGSASNARSRTNARNVAERPGAARRDHRQPAVATLARRSPSAIPLVPRSDETVAAHCSAVQPQSCHARRDRSRQGDGLGSSCSTIGDRLECARRIWRRRGKREIVPGLRPDFGATTMNAPTPPRKSLLERLDQGPVICAEGYVFELERRGYLQAGAFVPRSCSSIPRSSRSCIAISCTPARMSSRRSPTTRIARSCA